MIQSCGHREPDVGVPRVGSVHRVLTLDDRCAE